MSLLRAIVQRLPGSFGMRDGMAWSTGHAPALPPCGATRRGEERRVEGAAGTADRHVRCEKNAADVYAWAEDGAAALGTTYQPLDADLTTIAALADPNADRILFWDDSAGAYTHLTPGTNLTITATTIDALGGSGGGDASTNTATAVDSEIALFSGATGKLLKRATGSGIASLASGVLSASTAPTISNFTNAPHNHTAAIDGGQLAAAAMSAFDISDGILRVVDNVDATKKLALEVSGIATATTRTLTAPNYDGTIATLAGTETLSAKTLTTPTIASFTNATHTHVAAASGGTIAHTDLTSIGTNTHAQIDTHLAAANPHSGSQPLDADLTTIAGLTATTDNFLVSAASAWASRTPAQAKTSLALVKADVGLGNVDNTSDATKDAAATTLANKTLTTPTVASFTNATHAHQTAAGGGTLDAAAVASGTVATARLGSGTADATKFLRGDQTWATPAGGGGSTFLDNAFRVQDDLDATKQLAFDTSGITTATTRTLTPPNYSGTIATIAGSETLSNKNLASVTNTFGSIDAMSDVVITSAAQNQALVHNGSNFVNSANFGMIIGPWYLNDVAGTVANQEMYMGFFNTTIAVSGSAAGFGYARMPLAGRVVGAILNSDASRTAGTATLTLDVGGVSAAFNAGACALDATNTNRMSTFTATGTNFAAGGAIKPRISTSAWTPITADVVAWLIVKFDA